MKIDELTLGLLAFLSGRINRLEVEPGDERSGGILDHPALEVARRGATPSARGRRHGGGSCSYFPLCILRLELGLPNLKALGLFDHERSR